MKTVSASLRVHALTPASALVQYDIKARKTFLKRSPLPGVTIDDLFLGNSISVYARPLKIVAYADEFTAGKLSDVKSK